MRDKYKYILDSSIWVEIERRNQLIINKASPIINKNKVCLVDLIVAELLRGARSQSDYEGLSLRLNSFEIISTTWSEVGRLGFLVSKKGFSPPLSDLYIAQCAIELDKIIVTQDRHFSQIAKVKGFKLEIW